MSTEVTPDEIRKQAFKDVGEVLNDLVLHRRETPIQGPWWDRKMRWFLDAESGSPLNKLIGLLRGKLEVH